MCSSFSFFFLFFPLPRSSSCLFLLLPLSSPFSFLFLSFFSFLFLLVFSSPNPVALNAMNQANIFQQFQSNQFAYNPTLHVTTHDPAITSLVEDAAEVRHREVLGQTELEAKRLQGALLNQEREEVARTRAVVGHEAAEFRQRCNQEAEQENITDDRCQQTAPSKSTKGLWTRI